MNNKSIFLVKFTAVAVALSFFSPTVSIKTQSVQNGIVQSIPTQISFSFLNKAYANKIHKKDLHRKKTVNHNVNRKVRRRHDNFYRGGGYYVGGHYHPVAKFTMVALSGLAIGSIISSSSMSSDCSSVSVSGKNYKKCDGTYFEPFYEDDNLQYRAVNSPY